MNTGQRGETLVRQHYEARGYRCFMANFRTRQGEIDLILQNGEEWVFCEVKTRSPGALARPAEWVDARKQAKIHAAALAFLARYKLGEPPLRFDVAEVFLHGDSAPEIHCIENAF